ncbi:hypothetical protein IAQ61_002376 [Plenodomus lingam]|uniref:uncharacterized protein n=1 Tax=Leptosphaeria maculans TaxID=5022 RepID=UPI0033323592|nr:hypothetical protein IAQ61_002376 [Plenodomus lingam]
MMRLIGHKGASLRSLAKGDAEETVPATRLPFSSLNPPYEKTSGCELPLGEPSGWKLFCDDCFVQKTSSGDSSG